MRLNRAGKSPVVHGTARKRHLSIARPHPCVPRVIVVLVEVVVVGQFGYTEDSRGEFPSRPSIERNHVWKREEPHLRLADIRPCGVVPRNGSPARLLLSQSNICRDILLLSGAGWFHSKTDSCATL